MDTHKVIVEYDTTEDDNGDAVTQTICNVVFNAILEAYESDEFSIGSKFNGLQGFLVTHSRKEVEWKEINEDSLGWP